jgi:hypothetical protein
MKTKRKAISKRIRFAVFSRDGFACRYCGATSEKVQLVLDHIHPVSKGGTDEPENLVTSCFDCNSGKSDKTIEQAAINETHRLALAQEMREQAQALEVARKASEARARLRQEICNYYCELRGVESVSRSCLQTYVSLAEKHGPETLFQWMDCAAQFLSQRANDVDFVRYVCGIRRNQLAQQEGGANA